MPPELAIVIPTFNEAANVRPLLAALDAALAGIAWEAVFVDDDSGDGTAAEVATLARQDPRIRLLQRVGRRGLSSACIEGMLSTTAPFLAVMDADLQHDPALLPRMLASLAAGQADLAVGTRYAAGGSAGDMPRSRLLISRGSSWLARKLLGIATSDPLSGFFMIARRSFHQVVHRLSGKGFKILLDIIGSSPSSLRILEFPYTFRRREAGTSKLDTLVAWEFSVLLLEKIFGPLLPVRFVMFVAAGGLGACLHLLLLGGMHLRLGMAFIAAQAAATYLTMGLNFLANNTFTYRDRRLRRARLLRGVVLYYLGCSIGAMANLMAANHLFSLGVSWWLAGLLGAFLGAPWNYAVATTFIWRRDAPRA